MIQRVRQRHRPRPVRVGKQVVRLDRPRARRAHNERCRRAAGCQLLRSLENPCDGLVDTWVNRPLSRLMTRALVGTGISPNAVTLISFLVGLVGVARAARII